MYIILLKNKIFKSQLVPDEKETKKAESPNHKRESKKRGRFAPSFLLSLCYLLKIDVFLDQDI